MYEMFRAASDFNQPLSGWNVSNVTNMNRMFENATSFNQDLSNWCVTQIVSKPIDFDLNASSWVLPQPLWGTCPGPNLFISTWQIASPGDSITLPLIGSGTYNFNVNWGDGSSSTITNDSASHTYDDSGTYTVRIIGTIEGFNFGTIPTSKDNLSEILQWGCLRLEPTNNDGHFYYCSNLVLTGVTDTLNLTNVYGLNGTFRGCGAITTINNIEYWNTSNITGLTSIFESTSFNQDINLWDVSSVIRMDLMFRFSLFDQPLSEWNVSNVTNMIGMFQGTPFNGDINNWDVSSLIYADSMFLNSNFQGPISSWNVSNVTSMNLMFSDCPFDSPLSNWERTSPDISSLSAVTDMGNMFYNNTNFNQDIGNWNVSNVSNMTWMFRNASSFNQDLSNWCVANILSEPSLFADGATDWLGLPGTGPQWGTCP
jgi:surface protein